MPNFKRATVEEVIALVNPKAILVQSGNYLQYIDQEDQFKEVQYTPLHEGRLNSRWFEFKSVGRSDNPREIFVKWVTPLPESDETLDGLRDLKNKQTVALIEFKKSIGKKY